MEQLYTYELKQSLLTKVEKEYLTAVKQVLPEGYFIQPQVNLASIIQKTDDSKFYNELYRNIDACVFDMEYKPVLLIEINDSTHNQSQRIERDKKVKMICEEAGIPLIRFWTSYGINTEYMKLKISEGIEQSKNPVRIAHKSAEGIGVQNNNGTSSNNKPVYLPVPPLQKKAGCYIATAVYGSYDCPEVWVLRRFRDNVLSKNAAGKLFIQVYYVFSPWLLRYFGHTNWFRNTCQNFLSKLIKNLQEKGVESTVYQDKL